MEEERRNSIHCFICGNKASNEEQETQIPYCGITCQKKGQPYSLYMLNAKTTKKKEKEKKKKKEKEVKVKRKYKTIYTLFNDIVPDLEEKIKTFKIRVNTWRYSVIKAKKETGLSDITRFSLRDQRDEIIDSLNLIIDVYNQRLQLVKKQLELRKLESQFSRLEIQMEQVLLDKQKLFITENMEKIQLTTSIDRAMKAFEKINISIQKSIVKYEQFNEEKQDLLTREKTIRDEIKDIAIKAKTKELFSKMTKSEMREEIHNLDETRNSITTYLLKFQIEYELLGDDRRYIIENWIKRIISIEEEEEKEKEKESSGDDINDIIVYPPIKPSTTTTPPDSPRRDPDNPYYIISDSDEDSPKYSPCSPRYYDPNSPDYDPVDIIEIEEEKKKEEQVITEEGLNQAQHDYLQIIRDNAAIESAKYNHDFSIVMRAMYMSNVDIIIHLPIFTN